MMDELVEVLRNTVNSDTNIVVTGETGVGKTTTMLQLLALNDTTKDFNLMVYPELRGRETFDILSKMNGGYKLVTTMHAENAADLPKRLESLLGQHQNFEERNAARLVKEFCSNLVHIHIHDAPLHAVMSVSAFRNGQPRELYTRERTADGWKISYSDQL